MAYTSRRELAEVPDALRVMRGLPPAAPAPCDRQSPPAMPADAIAPLEAGSVVRVDDRGFGFVQRQSTGEHLFFMRAEQQPPAEFKAMLGRQVRFAVVATSRGPRATGVHIVAQRALA